MKARSRMHGGLVILLALLGVAIAVALARDPALIPRGLLASGRMVSSFWLELLVGVLLAGLLDVMIPRPLLAEWLGGGSLLRSLGVASLAGFVFPGGPYVAFPVAATLLHGGAAPGAVIAFLTAKNLLGLTRMLSWEVPLFGWQFTLARAVPALVLPLLLGLVGQWMLGRAR